MAKQYVYILMNNELSWITVDTAASYSDIQKTIKERSEGVPEDYTPLAIACGFGLTEGIDNATELENHFINKLKARNCKQRKEKFFQISGEDAIKIFQEVAFELRVNTFIYNSNLPKDRKLEQNTPKPPKGITELPKTDKPLSWTFPLIGIPIGEELNFINDRDKKVKVVEDQKVEYEGEIYSLSKLAGLLSKKDYPMAGPKCFEYKGKLVFDLKQAYINGGTITIKREKSIEETNKHIFIHPIIKKQAPAWTFEQYGIPTNAILEYKDDPNIKAIVLDNKKKEIKCNGKIYSSLSNLAEYLRHSKHKQGPAYFKYNGKLLTKIREEKELSLSGQEQMYFF